jgi:hypothetical protein
MADRRQVIGVVLADELRAQPRHPPVCLPRPPPLEAGDHGSAADASPPPAVRRWLIDGDRSGLRPGYVCPVSDVLEGGPGRSGLPRWVWLVAGVVALVAVGVYAAARGGHPGSAAPARSPASGLPSIGSGSPSPFPWPSAAGACGATAYRPLMSRQQLVERTGARLLVGGYGLRIVDADTGAARPVAGIPADARHMASELVSAGGAVYVVSMACGGGRGRVYRLENGAAHPVAGAPVGHVLAGATRVWAVDYAAAPTNRMVLRRLDGSRSLALPTDTYPVADTSAGLVIAVSPPDPVSSPPRILVLDPSTGRPMRSLGNGQPLTVDPAHLQLLLLLGPCNLGHTTPACTVARVDLRAGRTHGRYRLPDGRVPVSAGSASPDGRRVVFQLARADRDPRFDPGHPIPPSDVVVLNLDTGRLEVVPGLELAPKTGAGLVFADHGNWLFATVSDGDHTHLLAWHPGLGAPQSVARLDGPVAWAPPLLIT